MANGSVPVFPARKPPCAPSGMRDRHVGQRDGTKNKTLPGGLFERSLGLSNARIFFEGAGQRFLECQAARGQAGEPEDKEDEKASLHFSSTELGGGTDDIINLGLARRFARLGRLLPELCRGGRFDAAAGRAIEPRERGIVQIDRAQTRRPGARHIGGRLENIELRSKSRGEIAFGKGKRIHPRPARFSSAPGGRYRLVADRERRCALRIRSRA